MANYQEADVLEEVRILRERIDKECPSSMGGRVVSLLGSLKELEKQEIDFQSQRSSDCSRLQQEVDKLDKMSNSGANYEDSDVFHRSLQDSSERLESAKKELATKLRLIVSLKRQFDEVPSQAELIQYELRLSELNTQIQKKLRQTRKHYDTYNALLEIKDLMLKETSLLNSISLQFQNAITSADGRIKLTNSLEGILNGTQQKLEKVQLTFESEQKSCDTIKEKYTAAISEQRRSSSLLKLFQVLHCSKFSTSVISSSTLIHSRFLCRIEQHCRIVQDWSDQEKLAQDAYSFVIRVVYRLKKQYLGTGITDTDDQINIAIIKHLDNDSCD